MKYRLHIVTALLLLTLLLFAFNFIQTVVLPTGWPSFHPTKKAAHTKQNPHSNGTMNCSLYYITSSTKIFDAYQEYVEIDGYFNIQNKAYCGQVTTYAQVVQAAFGPSGKLEACVAVGIEMGGCSSITVPSVNVNQTWFVWSQDVDTNGHPASGTEFWAPASHFINTTPLKS